MAGDTALRIQDIGGKWHEPLADNKTTAVVLVFVLLDCPVANVSAAGLGRLH